MLGAYYGIKNRVPNDGHQHKPLKLPSMGLATDAEGMREAGSFYTSSDSYKPKVFSWSDDGGVDLDATTSDLNGVDIVVNTSAVAQPMDGFGAAFTDSSCWLLFQLKQSNATNYEAVMDYFFNNRTGFSSIRVPIGSSDYSAQGIYTFADTNATITGGNSSLANFTIQDTRAYILPVLQDAVNRRPDLKIMLSTWTPPAWMKTSNNTNGGQLLYGQEPLYAEYLAKSYQALVRAGVTATSLTIQNEPTRGTETYPSSWLSASSEAAVAASLRTQLATLGYHPKIFVHDDNFSGWSRAVDAIKANTSDGVAWHCYNGNASQIDDFNAATAGMSHEAHLTECTTTDDSDNQWWSTKYWLSNFLFPTINRGVRSFMAWNIVLDKKSKPYIENAPCENCQGAFTLTSPDNFMDPAMWAGNAQFIVTYHFAAATANLTRLGGGAAYRVAADAGTQMPSLGTAGLGCLSGISTFAAPWNGTNLATSSQKRIGMVVQNDCSRRTAMISVDGRRGTFKFSSGLTTLIFNA